MSAELCVSRLKLYILRIPYLSTIYALHQMNDALRVALPNMISKFCLRATSTYFITTVTWSLLEGTRKSGEKIKLVFF